MDQGNFTEDGPSNASLSSAFSKLTSMASSKPFSNVTVGLSDSSRVYAIFSCQHDLPLQLCHNCVANDTKHILDLFYPSPKEAIIMYEECMLRYANRMIFSTMELEPYDNGCSLTYYTHTTKIETTVKRVFESLIDQATKSVDYFAVGGVKNVIRKEVDLYFLVQCTPDITKEECNECLLHALNSTVASCGSENRLSGHTMGPSCMMKYDDGPFFYTNVTSMANAKKDGPWVTFGKVCSSILLVFLFFCIVCIKIRLACC